MCAADSTIEPAWKIFDDNGDVLDAGIDGEGFTHSCRSPALLWETVQRSEKEPLDPFEWYDGATVEDIFG